MKRGEPLKSGQIVVSTAGRDRGRTFLVIQVIDDEYALIANGDLRKIAKPKKKKRMHLRPTKSVCAEIAQRLTEGKPVFDYEIRASLKESESHKEE